MTSTLSDGTEGIIAPATPTLPTKPKIEIDDLGEITEVTSFDFRFRNGKVMILLKMNSGKFIRFTIGLNRFMMGITAAVTFMNLHLAQFFDSIGAP